MIWIVMIVGIAVDQISKILVAANLPFEETIPVIGNLFSLHYLHNEGAAWSMLNGRVGILLVITLVVTVFVAYLLVKTPKEKKFMRFSYALLIAGAVGNIIDRVRLGYVIDFLKFPHWPVFNIADCFVTVGIVLIAVLTIIDIKHEAALEAENRKNSKKK